MQEAILVLSMLLQRFEFVDFADYQLETKQTLTIKPNDFHIKVKLPAGRAATGLLTPLPPAAATRPAIVPQSVAPAPGADAHKRGCWSSTAPTLALPRA